MDRDPHIRPDGIWDDNYYQNIGRFLQGGSVPMPSFDFDFAGEAQRAYGELGAYYDRILKESRGDMNKVLARMATDYETGVRRRKEDRQTIEQTLTEDQALAMKNAQKAVENNAIARGIYQKSAYGPGGYGLADTNLQEAQQPIEQGYGRQRESVQRSFTRAGEDADVSIARSREDIPEQQRRYEHQLEQERRKEASNLANTRGSRSYGDWTRKNAFNPSLI